MGRSCPSSPHPGPRARLRQAVPPELCQDTRVLVLGTAGLSGQVSAFAHQLLERRALECCFEAPWHRSTWCFTHPFLNLILSPFHSSSHAVFTEVSHPHQTKHETSVPGAARGCSLNQARRQSTEHRSPPYRLRHPATHSGVTDPNLHLGGDSRSQGQTVK